jgi:hypothetical protein
VSISITCTCGIIKKCLVGRYWRSCFSTIHGLGCMLSVLLLTFCCVTLSNIFFICLLYLLLCLSLLYFLTFSFFKVASSSFSFLFSYVPFSVRGKRKPLYELYECCSLVLQLFQRSIFYVVVPCFVAVVSL